MSADFKDYSDDVLEELGPKIPIALEAVGSLAEAYAKMLCPVDTGLLRNSIAHAVNDDTAYIGTNVEYAPYVELGTSKQAPQPYLKPAVMDHANEYNRILSDMLNN